MNDGAADPPAFVGPTTDSWQTLSPAAPDAPAPVGPFRYSYPVSLPGNRALSLPLRALPDGRAAASLIANHAAFAVNDVIAEAMATRAAALGTEMVAGLPTLGLVYAPDVARRLGHAAYVPLGYSRKFWYDDALSAPVASITSPGAGKRLYLDPNITPRLAGRRVVLVDDAVSTGRTMAAAVRLLRRVGVEPVGAVVAMAQSTRWRGALAEVGLTRLRYVFGAPLFTPGPQGWMPDPETDPGPPE